MKPPDRNLLRLACYIHGQLQSVHGHQTDALSRHMENAADNLDRFLAVRRKLEICRQRSWHLAAQRLREDLVIVAGDIASNMQALTDAAGQEQPKPPLLRDIFEDLRQLKNEFDTYQYDPKEHLLSVETEPIELEDIYLGPFEIQLHLNRLSHSPLRIVALEPHPSTANDAVTHPHVSEENLCAGDATAAIDANLSAGRITDVFFLVRSVLRTYNSHSPYVSLEHWFGSPCSDCGYITDDDDRYSCNGCESDFCSECIASCGDCGESYCRGCQECCPCCDENFCKNCLKTCEECSNTCCGSCQVDGLCPSCQEKENSHEDDQSPVESTQSDTGAQQTTP